MFYVLYLYQNSPRLIQLAYSLREKGRSDLVVSYFHEQVQSLVLGVPTKTFYFQTPNGEYLAAVREVPENRASDYSTWIALDSKYAHSWKLTPYNNCEGFIFQFDKNDFGQEDWYLTAGGDAIKPDTRIHLDRADVIIGHVFWQLIPVHGGKHFIIKVINEDQDAPNWYVKSSNNGVVLTQNVDEAILWSVTSV